MRQNRFLRDKMIGRDQRRGDRRDMARGGGRGRDRAMDRERHMMEDMRNPYGSRGGYVRDRADMARGRDRARGDYGDYGYSLQDSRRGDYQDYDQELMLGGRRLPMSEAEAYGDNADYAMYDFANEEQYDEMLEKMIKKLKKKDKFKLDEKDIVTKAKQMGVKFDEYNEEEFVVVYYLMITDYPSVATDPHAAIAMAKDFFEADDDIELSPSEKLYQYITCISMYK